MEKKKIKIRVLPRIAMDDTIIDNDVLVISIVSPECEHPTIQGKHVYQFTFHDVDEEYLVGSTLYRPMEYEVAQQIVEVVINHRDKSEWIIHCEAGISRSPGVALGLSRYIELDPGTRLLEKSFPYYNKHVRNSVEKALRDKLVEMGELVLVRDNRERNI